jgi:hypothetical protein
MTASTYTPEIAAEILRRLSEGETLVAICREDGMPGRSTVHDWRKADPAGFGVAYDAAVELGCHALLDETLEIADDASGDYRTDKDGNPVLDSEHVQRSKLRIWTRHELIKRKRPDLFSEKVQLEHGGKLQVQQLDDSTLDARIAELMAKAGSG